MNSFQNFLNLPTIFLNAHFGARGATCGAAAPAGVGGGGGGGGTVSEPAAWIGTVSEPKAFARALAAICLIWSSGLSVLCCRLCCRKFRPVWMRELSSTNLAGFTTTLKPCAASGNACEKHARDEFSMFRESYVGSEQDDEVGKKIQICCRQSILSLDHQKCQITNCHTNLSALLSTNFLEVSKVSIFKDFNTHLNITFSVY
jgi:hypothetical protein